MGYEVVDGSVETPKCPVPKYSLYNAGGFGIKSENQVSKNAIVLVNLR